MPDFTPVPDTRAVGTGNPAADMDATADELAAMGGSQDILNAAYSGGADPTDTTDSTAAIAAALAAMPSTGGTLTEPAGTYKISAALAPPSYSTQQGAGLHATVISQATANVHGIYAADKNAVSLRDMTILGPGDTAGTGNGVYFTIVSNGATSANYLQNLVIKDFGNNGFVGDGLITSVLINVEAQLCAENGFDLVDGTSVTLFNCYANSVSGYGYLINGMSYSALLGCASDYGEIGYYIEAANGLTLTGCGAEYQTVGAYKISGASAGVVLAGCFCWANPGIGCLVTGDSTATITGFLEIAPGGGATASIQVDAGSTATIIDPDYVTAPNYQGNVTEIRNGVTTVWAGGAIVPQEAELLIAPSGATGETCPRSLATSASSASLTSGEVYVAAIGLHAGIPVNNITAFTTSVSGSNVATEADITHGWYALLDNTGTVRAVSADTTGGATAFMTAAETGYTKSVAGSAYTTTYTGLYYVAFGMSVSGGNMPQLATRDSTGTNGPASVAPVLQGTMGTQAAAPAAGTQLASGTVTYANSCNFYAYTS